VTSEQSPVSLVFYPLVLGCCPHQTLNLQCQDVARVAHPRQHWNAAVASSPALQVRGDRFHHSVETYQREVHLSPFAVAAFHCYFHALPKWVYMDPHCFAHTVSPRHYLKSLVHRKRFRWLYILKSRCGDIVTAIVLHLRKPLSHGMNNVSAPKLTSLDYSLQSLPHTEVHLSRHAEQFHCVETNRVRNHHSIARPVTVILQGDLLQSHALKLLHDQ
jgi:hypothetical protein